MDFNKGLKDKWLVLPIIILFLSLAIRIYWTFINLSAYPFERINDAGNHIIFLFFLAKYGFHHLVPNYWNGFILLNNYGPGWHFLSLPLYYLTGNAVSATFLSLIQSLSLGFFFILILGRLMGISIIKRILFFGLFFASPVLLDYIQIGRYPELTGWVLFIPFFTLIVWYKNYKLDKKFLIFIPVYSLIILTHVYVLFPASFLIISLFLIKKFKEKIIITLSVILSFILTYFWWGKAFLFMFTNSDRWKASFELAHIGSIISYNTIILLSFLFVFYFYYKSSPNRKRELLFYSPLLILSLLILTRLIILVPVFNNASIMPYNALFLFLVIYLFFRIRFDNFPMILKKTLPFFLIALSISIFVFAFLRVEYSSLASVNPVRFQLRSELLSILPEIEGRYMFIPTETVQGEIPQRFPKMLDAHVMDYAVMYYNLSTPFGTTFPGVVPSNMREVFGQVYGCSGVWWEDCPEEVNLNCDFIKEINMKYNVRSLVSHEKGCDLFKECGFEEKVKRGQVCLFIDKTIPS